MSYFDLKSGFNQIKVRPADRKKTAFLWKGKVYHFVGAPKDGDLGDTYDTQDALYGRRFTLYTDHQSLIYLLTRDKISSVIENWMFEILSFDFEIKHLPGIENHLADVLSRFYDNDPRMNERPDYVRLLGALPAEETQSQDLQELWVQGSPITPGILGVVEDNELEGIVFSEPLGPEDLSVVEDTELQQTYMKRAHANGHLGAGDMVRQIKSAQRVIWPNMFRQCQEQVSGCLPCQRYNIGSHGYHPPNNLKALYPFDHLCIDLKEMPTSARGNNYILIVVDVATRMVFLRELQDKSMYSIAQRLLR